MRTDSTTYRRPLLASLLIGAALIAACGGGTEELTASDPGPVAAPAPAPPDAGTGTATLSWGAPPASVIGYRVYYGTASRNYSQPLGAGEFASTSSHIVTGLRSGRTYYFAVTAIDPAGAESGFSNEASKTIP